MSAVPENIAAISLGEITNTCFVVMPFAPLFDTQYEQVIRPAVEATGLQCVRGDEIFAKPQIIDDIWKSIRHCRVVVAELTGRNPNVLYEVGLAHAVGKPIILLTRDEDDVPFDLKALRYRYYDTDDPFWGDNLQRAIQEMVTAALDESSLSVWLEGISVNQQVPELNSAEPPPEPQPEYDLSGHWSGNWKRENASITHLGKLFLAQDGNRLLGTLTVSFEKSGDLTVVQEELSGLVNNDAVTLSGTSYTYIRQGNSTSYLLDNFEMSIQDNQSQLQGVFQSRRGIGECAFVRNGA